MHNKINGILLLDKPSGLSSRNVLNKISKIYNIKKAGYIGTLDPLASGILPVCFNEATKFCQHLSMSNKRYIVEAKLGQKTDTADIYGKIINENKLNFNITKLHNILSKFSGNIFQVPSMYSAIKYKGKRLYEYARIGLITPRITRVVTIYEMLLKKFNRNNLELEIHCSKGTYIRTIIDDIGDHLGCGAHVISLRRIQLCNYHVSQTITLKKINEIIKHKTKIDKINVLNRFIIPIEKITNIYPEINIENKVYYNLRRGKTIMINNTKKTGSVIITYGSKHLFAGIATITKNGLLQPKRLMSTNQQN